MANVSRIVAKEPLPPLPQLSMIVLELTGEEAQAVRDLIGEAYT